MLVAKGIEFWCLAIFVAFALILILLLKFWVGRCNKYDQNGMFETELGTMDLKEEKPKEEFLPYKNEGSMDVNKGMQDFQQQISLQWTDTDSPRFLKSFRTDSPVFFKY